MPFCRLGLKVYDYSHGREKWGSAGVAAPQIMIEGSAPQLQIHSRVPDYSL